MAKKLMIVESPAKAKTLEKYLGGDFVVKSSYGHIRDLDKGDKAIDIEHNYKPKYIIPDEKKKVVSDLKKAVKQVSEVWLATDEDREGEAISWHLSEVLGLDLNETKRIVFHEITKPAIKKAVENPRFVNINLVNAQQARRVLDRLVGFKLSELLWRKVKNKLSAGRVQSITLRLIVEREREIQNFSPEQYYKVTAVFLVKNEAGQIVELKAELKDRLTGEDAAEDFITKARDAEFSIKDIEKKPIQKKPAPPFTTSTLQQEASRKLGFPVGKTMSVAQKLYEQGLITYMRTDSVTMSNLALSAIANLVSEEFGESYSQVRRYQNKNKSAQEAHEAIRPAYIERKFAGTTNDQQRLYELIWKRAVASQMANAQLEKTLVGIRISTIPEHLLRAEGEVIKFEGFLKVYMVSTDDDQDKDVKGMLPPLHIGQKLELKVLTALQRQTKAPARYTEASLVKKLEELGIGRPSTYAPTISKIMEKGRGYVTKESREGTPIPFKRFQLMDGKIAVDEKIEQVGSVKNRLFASDIGMIVTDFLKEHFEEIMNYGFTAEIESQFDEVAQGKFKWQDMIDAFYHPFKKILDKTMDEAQRAKGRRVLGQDPATGHSVLVQLTRFGPVVQIGTREEVGEGHKPRFANLKPGQSMEKITFDEAMELFKLPRKLNDYLEKPVVIGAGRFGPYVKWDDKYISIPRGEDPLELTYERAVELIDAKRKQDEPIGEYEGHPITRGKGRFGPFLKWNNLFVNIPKKYDPEHLSRSEVMELLQAKIKKEANRYIHRWEDLDLSVQNGRWGPFIKFGKKNIKLPKVDGQRMTSEQAKALTLDEIKQMVTNEIPAAFTEKKKSDTKTKSKSKVKAKK